MRKTKLFLAVLVFTVVACQRAESQAVAKISNQALADEIKNGKAPNFSRFESHTEFVKKVNPVF